MASMSYSPDHSFETQQEVVSPPRTQSADAAPLDDLDRAWLQQQNDYIFQPYGGAPQSTSAVGIAIAAGSAAKGAGGSTQPARVAAGIAAAKPAPVPVAGAAGAKKGGKVVQPIEAAQWYQNPDQLEVRTTLH
jgi:hypothetical protein